MKNKIEKTLSHYIMVKHTRYISEAAEAELRDRTTLCDAEATNPERLYWLLENLMAYPHCKACDKQLSSFHWEPFLKLELRDLNHIERKSGYRPFCSRECSYNFDGLKAAKYKKTSLERFGVSHPMKSKSVISVLEASNLAKTGESWPMRWGSPLFVEKLQETHGASCVRDLQNAHTKIIESISKKSTEQLPLKIKKLELEHKVECLSNLEGLGQIYNRESIEFKWVHSCGHEYVSKIGTGGSIKVCPECYISRSRAEQDLGDYIESLGFEIVRNDRTVVGPKELDIYVPSLKVGIEFDGTYWHSAKFQDKKTSIEKVNRCEALGIRLITVQEGYWNQKSNLVKSRLKSILGVSTKLHGRKFRVVKLDSIVGRKFLELNHLQGASRAIVYYGLEDSTGLMAVMSFGRPRWSSIAEFELIRFATKTGFTIVGGASKLLKAFRNDYSGSILSYADRCWSTGGVYKTLGFKYSHKSTPSYWWVSEKLGIYSRYQTQKKALPKLLGGLKQPFAQVLSEDDNMKLAGFLKVYDRGNTVWVLD